MAMNVAIELGKFMNFNGIFEWEWTWMGYWMDYGNPAKMEKWLKVNPHYFIYFS